MPGLCVKFTRNLIYIFIIISLAGFINPSYSLAKSNGLLSSQIHVNINPLRDLGIDKGYICFRIKAYSNTEISKFSKPACTYRKNSKDFKLAWAKGPSSVIGYQVYFGDSAKKTETFLADVLQILATTSWQKNYTLHSHMKIAHISKEHNII
jgi:hypothetical protein